MLQYYRILGLPKNASEQEIKKAFRKMALQYHPDKNNSLSAKRKFQEITDAYNFLCGNHSEIKEPRLSPQQMADLLEKKYQDEKRKRFKVKMKTLRMHQLEMMQNSRLYKLALRIQRLVAYATIGIAIALVVIPIITFCIEFGDVRYSWDRGLYLGMIMALGGVFMYGGVYLVKNKKQ